MSNLEIHLPDNPVWLVWVEDGLLVSSPILFYCEDRGDKPSTSYNVIASPNKTLEAVRHPNPHVTGASHKSGRSPKLACPGAIPLTLNKEGDNR